MNTTPIGWVGYRPEVKVTERKPLKVCELIQLLEAVDQDAIVRTKSSHVFGIKREDNTDEPFVLLT